MSKFYAYGGGIAQELESEIRALRMQVLRVRLYAESSRTDRETKATLSKSLKSIERRIDSIIEERQPQARKSYRKDFVCGTIEKARQHFRDGMRAADMDEACREIYNKVNKEAIRQRRADAKKRKEQDGELTSR